MKLNGPQIKIGLRFGSLVVLGNGTPNGKLRTYKCECDCGNSTTVVAYSLPSGNTKSCGCTRVRKLNRWSTTHGLCGTVFHTLWNSIKMRCFDTNYKEFYLYGGRGIAPCEAIRESPIPLKEILGERPEGMSIDRIDTNGGYWCGRCKECLSLKRPTNIRWATKKEQTRNRRISVANSITINGVTKPRYEWAEQAGIGYHTFKYRVYAGWTGEALLAPTIKRTSVQKL